MSEQQKQESAKPRPKSKAALFLELARPDEDGFSRPVYVSEFVGKYAELKFENGGSWCRKDGPLGRVFNVEIKKSGETGVYKTLFIRLHGFNKNPRNTQIPKNIREHISKERCVILFTSKPEADHKDGRKDYPGEARLQHFQPLSKAANDAKRRHCKECAQSGRRFDATQLGFRKAQIKGNGVYRGSCVGCYWYDPKTFAAFFIEP